MFKTIWSDFVTWWNQCKEENEFVHNTLSELHQKLLVFDCETDFWTEQGVWGITIYRGEKFPLYPSAKSNSWVCKVTLEKRSYRSGLIVQYRMLGLPAEHYYPVAYLNTVVADIRKHYGV